MFVTGVGLLTKTAFAPAFFTETDGYIIEKLSRAIR
jgi:hypothetical protein